jgi:hypothetical protein
MKAEAAGATTARTANLVNLMVVISYKVQYRVQQRRRALSTTSFIDIGADVSSDRWTGRQLLL